MPEPKIPINVRLSPQTHKGLERLRKRKGVTFQALAEQAFTELLARENAEKSAA